MNEEDEHLQVEHASISAQSITVNTGWSPQMAFWNTLGTVGSFIAGLLGLLLAYSLYLRQNNLEDYMKKQSPSYQKDMK